MSSNTLAKNANRPAADATPEPKTEVNTLEAYNLSEAQNTNLRKALLWAASRMSPSLRLQLAELLKKPLKAGGVLEDRAADDRRHAVNRDKAIKALTDHVEFATKHGASEQWLARADMLAFQLRGFLVPYEALTFYELRNPKAVDAAEKVDAE